MKNTFLLLMILCFTLPSFGQTSDNKLISRYKPGIGWYYSGIQPYEEGKLRKYDRLVVDIVYSDWTGDRDAFQSPWTSIGFNAALLFDKVITKENTFSIGWGLGFSHTNNRTKQLFQSNTEAGNTQSVDLESNSTISRAKFSANYIELPIELRFRTKGYQHFKFMLGGKIGYQLNAYTKTTQEINNQRYSVKAYNFPDNNPLRYGVTARIGIRNWALYGAYYFSPLFTNRESIQLTPLELGVSISLF